MYEDRNTTKTEKEHCPFPIWPVIRQLIPKKSQNNNVIKTFFERDKEVIIVISAYTIIFKNHINCNFYVCLGTTTTTKKNKTK